MKMQKKPREEHKMLAHFSFNKKPFIPPTAVSLKTASQGLGYKNIKNRQHITHKINT